MTQLEDYRDRIERWSLAWFAGLCLLFAYPVIAADILHRDDVWRAASGQYLWLVQGRPLADFVTQVLSLSGASVVGSAPFSQIVFGFCLFLSFLLATRFLEHAYGEPFSLPLAILLINPFLLGNLLYQYDSLGMGIGIVLTVAAFVTGSSFDTRRLVLSIVLLTLAAGIYQPLLNLLIGLCAIQIAVIAVSGNDTQEMLRILLLRAAQYCGGAVLYFLTIGLPLSAANGRSEVVSFDSAGLQTAIDAGVAFIAFALRFLQSGSLSFQIMYLGFICVGVFSAAIWISRGQKKSAAFIAFALAGSVAILSLFGPLILVEDVLVSYRTMPSVAAPLAVLAIFLCRSKTLWPVAIVPLFAAVVMSSQIMATYKAQRDYDEFVVGLVAAEVNAQKKYDHNLYTFGAVDRAPHAVLGAELHTMIDDLTAPAQQWVFEGLLIQKGMRNTVALWSHQRAESAAAISEVPCADIVTIVSTDLFTIQETGQTLLVILKGAEPPACKG